MRPLVLFLLVLTTCCGAPVLDVFETFAQDGAEGKQNRHGMLYPVVLWHGMGDSCCDPQLGIGYLKAEIERNYGGFVYSIGFGTGAEDVKNSYFGNVNDQVEQACKELAQVEELQDGFDAIGFSQGGQFLRAVVERCHHKLPPIRLLITLGAQHQGIMNIPSCPKEGGYLCSLMRFLLTQGAYLSWPASHIVQAQYVKDPYNLDDYLANNIFLPDINNEREVKNALYASNMAKLGGFIMIRFRDDTTVVPRDSAWFSYFNGTDTVPIREQPIYTEDWIGLKQLDELGLLAFDECPTAHMRFTWEWFDRIVIKRYLVGHC